MSNVRLGSRCLSIVLSVSLCTSPLMVEAQDREVIGDPLSGSPYDRATGGVKTRATPTPISTPAILPPEDRVDPRQKKKKEFPQSGVLSSVVTSGYGRSGIPSISSPDLEGDTLPPITGSVSRISGGGWKIKVSNNTEDPMSSSVKIQQITNSGSVLKTDSFTFSLRPKESVERSVSGVSSAEGAQLVLERYTQPKKKKSVTAPGQTPGTRP